MIQAAIILVIIAAIAGVGFVTGKKWEKSIWQPTYYTLAKQMTSMQHELNIKAEKQLGEANVVSAEITVIGEVSKSEKDRMDAEVNHRVEMYLNNLLANGVQPVSEEGNSSNQSSATSSLSASARASFERGGASGLFANLDEFERAALKEIIRKGMNHQTEAIIRQQYLENQESKMNPLRN